MKSERLFRSCNDRQGHIFRPRRISNKGSNVSYDTANCLFLELRKTKPISYIFSMEKEVLHSFQRKKKRMYSETSGSRIARMILMIEKKQTEE